MTRADQRCPTSNGPRSTTAGNLVHSVAHRWHAAKPIDTLLPMLHPALACDFSHLHPSSQPIEHSSRHRRAEADRPSVEIRAERDSQHSLATHGLGEHTVRCHRPGHRPSLKRRNKGTRQAPPLHLLASNPLRRIHHADGEIFHSSPIHTNPSSANSPLLTYIPLATTRWVA